MAVFIVGGIGRSFSTGGVYPAITEGAFPVFPGCKNTAFHAASVAATGDP